VRLGRPDCIENDSKGFRDVYWCWHINEPVVLEYAGSDLLCRNCGTRASNLEDFEDEHMFIVHIRKPGRIGEETP
jgi:hypothetical protein